MTENQNASESQSLQIEDKQVIHDSIAEMTESQKRLKETNSFYEAKNDDSISKATIKKVLRPFEDRFRNHLDSHTSSYRVFQEGMIKQINSALHKVEDRFRKMLGAFVQTVLVKLEGRVNNSEKHLDAFIDEMIERLHSISGQTMELNAFREQFMIKLEERKIAKHQAIEKTAITTPEKSEEPKDESTTQEAIPEESKQEEIQNGI